MKLVKYFSGTVVLLFAIWIILGEQITGASSNAVANARLSTIRAPISGIVSTNFSTLGAQITTGTIIGEINNQWADTLRSDQLTLDHAILIAEKSEIVESLSITNMEVMELQALLTHQTEVSKVMVSNKMYRVEERIRLLEEIEAARVITKGAKLSAKSVLNSKELSREYEDLDNLSEVKFSLDKNIFVGENYASLFQLQNLMLQEKRSIARLKNALQLNKTKIFLNEAEQIKESKRININQHFIIKSKLHSKLWEKLVTDGEMVTVGQEIFKLVICNSGLVTLSVSKSIYNNLEVGQKAKFFLDNNDLSYDGKITRLAGSNASKIYRGLAVPPSLKNEDRFDVMLSVPKLANDIVKNCKVGQTGRVYFDRRPLDWIRNLIS